MKSLELKPTKENLISTFLADSIGRTGDVCSFVDMLINSDNVSTIGIDGRWGTGKTFFVKQCKMILDSLNPIYESFSKDESTKIIKKYESHRGTSEENYPPLLTTYYDAWEHDDEDDPVLSLIYEIMKENYCKSKIDNIRSLKDIILNIANIVSNKNLKDLFLSIEGKDIFESQKSNETIDVLIENFFKMLLPESGNKLIVFIDELDRCSPAYAIKLLERIKHYFSCENVTFVFSVNFKELENSIRHFYGEKIDSCRYLDRFFDLRTILPAIDMNRYLEKLGSKVYGNIRESITIEMINQLNMGMREASRYILLSKIAAHKYTDTTKNNSFNNHPYENSYLIGYCVIVPIAIGLKMTNSEDFDNFMNGTDSSWLERIILSENFKHWIGRLLIDDKKSNDTYDQDLTNKIREIYKAIFVTTRISKGIQPEVGNIVIREGFYYSISRAVGLVSPYSDYSA